MITIDIRNDIAFIEIDDGKANVIDKPHAEAFMSALDRAEAEAKATVIRGAGDKFCAGFHLPTMQAGGAEKAELIGMGFRLLYRLYSHPQPLVAACNGHAIGLGAFILLCCDNRLGADTEYKIGLPETASGMPFTPFLIMLIREELNRSFITSMALQSQMNDPNTAIKSGFLDMLVNSDQLASAAEKGASMLMTLPKTQYAENKLELREKLLADMKAYLASIGVTID